MTSWLLYPSRFEPLRPPDAPAAPTQWFAPFSEPRKFAVAVAVLAASGCTLPPRPPDAAPQGWFSPLSVPVQVQKPRQSEFRLLLQPIDMSAVAPAWGWFNPLSAVPPTKKQFATSPTWAPQVVAPDPVAPNTSWGWQAPLSEPSRAPRAGRGELLFPLAPPALPPNGWQYQFGQPVKATGARYQPAGLVTPPQPPAVIVPPPEQWFCALSVPLFQPQNIRTRTALVNSFVFSFGVPSEIPPLIFDPYGALLGTARKAVVIGANRKSTIIGQ